MEHNYVERIYKMYLDLGSLADKEAEQYVKKISKDFKKGFNDRQKLLIVTNRSDISELRIITTYQDQHSKQYYITEY